ncbi:PAP2 superfamily protein [Phyllobacterium sp. YR620]|uniref:acid phosphatase n=1 Tax=Phyllobacterium sp. YR620 TaxID=1881066 RepID=UPI00088DA8FA|nr:phosphatase PAP2 family protein [Phyllobacterium sp. YR620]SDP54565.1 PAP2 superfamily protein [Phyllobacterium sp. YR620]
MKLAFLRVASAITMAAIVATIPFVSSGISKEASSYGGTELGTVPEFHPELGMGWLRGYLDPKALPNSLVLIPRPPEPSSAAQRQDDDIAQRTFALRGTPRFTLAEGDFDLKFSSLMSDFSCASNTQIAEENAPYLSTLLRRSVSDIGLSTYTAKNYYHRKRPFQQNHEPIGLPTYQADLEKDPSYPSGHTAIGWGVALILSEIMPDRADELLARGRAFGESRMVVNHHWYSDVVWGRFMGAATVARLHADPVFRADMEAARAEVASIRTKGLAPTHDCKAESSALALGFQASETTAIDILLEPDAVMLQHAKANNARLLSVFPKGFPLDVTHTPHITLIQRFVRTSDLDKVYAATNSVLAKSNLSEMKLEAIKYYYIPSGDTGVAGIVIKQTPALIKLQADLIEAVTPFTMDNGDSSAFFTTPDDPLIDPLLIEYVAGFVPKASGERFNPHVSTGAAPQQYLDQMVAEPFESFAFSPAGAAVYQLGQFGTAAVKLKQIDSAK